MLMMRSFYGHGVANAESQGRDREQQKNAALQRGGETVPRETGC